MQHRKGKVDARVFFIRGLYNLNCVAGSGIPLNHIEGYRALQILSVYCPMLTNVSSTNML